MSVNSLNQVSQQLPLGATGVVFAGWSSQGDYTYTTSVPVGNYIAYASPNGSNNFLRLPNSLGTSALTLSAANFPTGSAAVSVISAETAINFASSLVAVPVSTTIFPGGGSAGFIYDGTNIFQAGETPSSLIVSTNGITWTSRTPVFGTAQTVAYSGYNRIAFNNGVTNKYIIVGRDISSTGGYISTSTDGVTWTARTGVAISSNQNANGVVINAAATVKYCLVNYSASTGNEIYSSTDAVTWVQRTVIATSSPYSGGVATNGTAATNQIYVYANRASSGNNISTSTNGITWTTRSSAVPSTGSFGVAWGAGLYVVGTSSATAYTTSTDGVTWTSRSFTVGNFGTSGVWPHFLNGLFHIWGNSQYITSTDGITWIQKNNILPVSTTGFTAIWNGTRYIVNPNADNYTGRNSYYALYSTTGSTTLN
jgi:hypothetical protein